MADRNALARLGRSFAITAVLLVVLGAAILVAVSLNPEQPKLSGDTSKQREHLGYRAGGADCQPSEIEQLEGSERARRTVACQEAAENYRLKANELIQQRRSADAADAMTILTYQQTSIAAWGAALGLITMVAAIAAAFYARSAAVHSDKSHRAFLNAERAVLRVVSAQVGRMSGQGEPYDMVAFTFKNIGRTPARIIAFGSKTEDSAPRWVDVPVGETAIVPGFPPPADIRAVLDGWFWIEYTVIGGGIGTSNFRVRGDFRIDPYTSSEWFFEVFNADGHPDDT